MSDSQAIFQAKILGGFLPENAGDNAGAKQRGRSMEYTGKIHKIRNAAGGDTPYVFEAMLPEDGAPTYGARTYEVRHTGRFLTWWKLTGHGCDVYATNAGTAFRQTPPGYVLDRIHREWARDELRDDLKPGTTVYTILEHVGRSGMSRRIGVRVFVDNDPHYLDGLVAIALGEPVPRDGGIRVDGCGMDMGFELVYRLSRALYPDGFGCIGRAGYPEKRDALCPSNDHANGDGDYTPHPGCGTPDARGTRDHWHNEGGYALNHRWL